MASRTTARRRHTHRVQVELSSLRADVLVKDKHLAAQVSQMQANMHARFHGPQHAGCLHHQERSQDSIQSNLEVLMRSKTEVESELTEARRSVAALRNTVAQLKWRLHMEAKSGYVRHCCVVCVQVTYIRPCQQWSGALTVALVLVSICCLCDCSLRRAGSLRAM